VRQPHSAQRYIGPVDDFPMPRTVVMGCDTPGMSAAGSAPRPDGGEGKNDAEIYAVIFGF